MRGRPIGSLDLHPRSEAFLEALQCTKSVYLQRSSEAGQSSFLDVRFYLLWRSFLRGFISLHYLGCRAITHKRQLSIRHGNESTTIHLNPIAILAKGSRRLLSELSKHFFWLRLNRPSPSRRFINVTETLH